MFFITSGRSFLHLKQLPQQVSLESEHEEKRGSSRNYSYRLFSVIMQNNTESIVFLWGKKPLFNFLVHLYRKNLNQPKTQRNGQNSLV